MVLINKAINEVTVKLVYYGPGLCGKTTNLEKIYANPKLDNKGKMISMSTETDRTLFFDFMPMELGTIAGQKVRVQLYTVPGQVFYDATRKLVLRGTDGVVFVADSQESMTGSNLESLENLRTNLRLNRLDPDKIAMVFQYNKRDLPNVSSIEEMTGYLQPGNAPVVEASAITGAGVTATLRAAVSRILENLKKNVDVTMYDAAPLNAPDMTQKAGVAAHSAGTPKLSMRSGPEGSSTTHADAEPFSNADLAAEIAAEIEEDPFGQSMPASQDSSATEEQVFESSMPESMASGAAEAAPVAHEIPLPLDPLSWEPEPDEQPSFDAVDLAEQRPSHARPDDPFASATSSDSDREELEELAANARAVVATLEVALERARENERVLSARLKSRG